ncbi:MAG: DedA family protein [Gemmatimonadota bacterium]|jgi:membrane protein DedA with SNARE-associated domain|nr:DedA family protein [Gemmatimonadota bacterium]
MSWFDRLLETMLLLPAWAIHLVLGIAAAVENLVPPIPADVVVLFGGFLTARGGGNPWSVFLATWSGNVAGAMLVYALGRGYGAGFFRTPVGALLLQPRQLAQLDAFYQRYGFGVIFVSRFLPVFRSLVPAFAGMSGLGVLRTAVPVAIASGIWYGLLVYLGATAGRNWTQIRAAAESTGRWFLIPAVLLTVAFIVWWRRSRRSGSE